MIWTHKCSVDCPKHFTYAICLLRIVLAPKKNVDTKMEKEHKNACVQWNEDFLKSIQVEYGCVGVFVVDEISNWSGNILPYQSTKVTQPIQMEIRTLNTLIESAELPFASQS